MKKFRDLDEEQKERALNLCSEYAEMKGWVIEEDLIIWEDGTLFFEGDEEWTSHLDHWGEEEI